MLFIKRDYEDWGEGELRVTFCDFYYYDSRLLFSIPSSIKLLIGYINIEIQGETQQGSVFYFFTIVHTKLYGV